jgi:hypothetical protein
MVARISLTTLPNQVVVGYRAEYLHFLWIPLIGFPGRVLGFNGSIWANSGDLPYTVKCVQQFALR